MLKLNDIKSVAVGIDMSSVKTHALPHSIVNESSLSYRMAEPEAQAALLPKYFVYVEDDGSSLGLIKKAGVGSPEDGAVLTGVSDAETTFAEDAAIWSSANDLSSGKIEITTQVEVDSLGTEETSVEEASDSKVVINLPEADGRYAITQLIIEDGSDPVTFDFSAVDDPKLVVELLAEKTSDSVKLFKDNEEITSLTLGTHTLSVVGTEISIAVTDGSATVTHTEKPIEKAVDPTKDKVETVVKVSFGQDGKNKTHTVTPATLTKTNKFINGLMIAVKFTVDEVEFVTLGTLNPADGTISVNGIILPDCIDKKVEGTDTVEDSENTRLLKEIDGWKSGEHITNVQCMTVNNSLEDVVVINWETSDSEVKELHPQDTQGNPIENIVPGSVILGISPEDPYDNDKEIEGESGQEEGVIILSDHAVKEETDDDGFVHQILDINTVTSGGVLNRFRSVKYNLPDGTEVSRFEKEAYSVGKVFYNTGIIELNAEIPIVYGVSPALYCKAIGMDNLRFNINNKGTDGNKYSLKVLKDHIENNGDVIYNVVLMLNGVELDSVLCSSNPDGSVIEGTDANGNAVDVEIPFIGTLEHDVFSASFTNTDPEVLKSLHGMVYNFDGGTDGVDGITASDYIGYKDESGTAGAWLFDDAKYPAQMWPSLGYTDKEFYMGAKDIAWNRKDTTCVWDIPKGYSKKTAIDYREEDPVPADWWTELYYNWCNDVYNGSIVALPPSYYVTKNSLASYKTNGTWYPVAGKERGTIDAASVINQVPAKLDRDEFITHNINPIYDTGTQGIQIYGNETLNGQYTDLSAAHIARTLTYIRSKVDAYTETLKFELNDVVLWRTWIDYVKTRILEPIKAARGLQWFRVSMGNDTTTREELASRIVRGVVECQFVPDAEIFKLEYQVYSSAADNSTF